MGKKVTFTLSIGYYGANQRDTFDIEDEFNFIEGVDYETEEELEELLEEEWKEWSRNYIDGGFHLEEES